MTPRSTLTLLLLSACCCGCAATIHIGGQGADFASTQWAKQQDAVEANPLVPKSTSGLAALKLAEAGAFMWWDKKLEGRPGVQKVFRIGSALLGWGVAGWNVKEGLEAKQGRERKR